MVCRIFPSLRKKVSCSGFFLFTRRKSAARWLYGIWENCALITSSPFLHLSIRPQSQSRSARDVRKGSRVCSLSTRFATKIFTVTTLETKKLHSNNVSEEVAFYSVVCQDNLCWVVLVPNFFDRFFGRTVINWCLLVSVFNLVNVLAFHSQKFPFAREISNGGGEGLN